MGEAERWGLSVDRRVPLAVRASEAAEAGMRTMEHLNEGSSREDELRPRVVEGMRSGDEMPGANLFRSLAGFSAKKCAALHETLARHRAWQVPTLAGVVGRTRDLVGRQSASRLPPGRRADYWIKHLAGEALSWRGGLREAW